MIESSLFTLEHEALRDSYRRLAHKEIVPSRGRRLGDK